MSTPKSKEVKAWEKMAVNSVYGFTQPIQNRAYHNFYFSLKSVEEITIAGQNFFQKKNNILMKQEEIKSIMGVYENLIEFVKAKAKVLSGTNSKYCIYKGINSIYFEDDKVYVECDDSTYGTYETSTFSFPIEWLSMEDSELVSHVLGERERELKRIAEATAERLLKEEKQKEQSQFELYKQLKAKFENL